MSDGFSELVKIYIENLNLPSETKEKLLAVKPKTLAEVSLWLDQNKEIKQSTTSFNPFATENKNEIIKDIKLFSTTNDTLVNFASNHLFGNGEVLATDDASWGLGIEKTSSTSSTTGIKLYSASTKQSTQSKKQTNFTTAEQAKLTKESQDNAISSIKESVNNAIESVMTQMEEQGIISKGYNSVKEFFSSNMALSSVCRVIFAEDKTAELLELAQKGELTASEYYKAKIDLIIDMLVGDKELSAHERACLRERFAQYTPEQLNNLIDKVKNCNNEEYAQVASGLDKLIKEGEELLNNQASTEGKTVNVNANPNSIKALLTDKNGVAEKLLTFEEVFKLERGVEFSPTAIEQYEKDAAEFAMAATITNKAQALHESLDKPLALVKCNNQPGVNPQTREAGEKQLETSLLNSLKNIYGNNEEKINERLQELSNGAISYQNGEIKYSEYGKSVKGNVLASTVEKLLEESDKNVEKYLNGKTLVQYQNKMAKSYEKAYGVKNATQLAKAFSDDQEGIVGKVRAGVEYVGAGVMVAGMFIYPPVALIGALIASFGGIAVEAINESTKKDGLTKEAKEKITKEILQNSVLFVVGGAAGKVGSAAKAALLAQKCPTLMACVADIGLDSTISLLGDMVITGEIDLSGEALSQLTSLLAGHYRAGKFGKKPISKQDITPSKNPAFNKALEHLKQTDPKFYEDYQLLRSKNLLPENLFLVIYNPQNSTLNANLKKDISLMADCVRKGIDPKDVFIPKFKNLEEASKTKKTGDVFSLEGTNDLYIMDDSGPIKLDMDRDMYYALFPPIQSHATNQGSMGDCYFVSAILDVSMNNPKAKIEMLKMFHQKGDDIIFEHPNYGDDETYDFCPRQVVFKNAKKRLSMTANKGIEGAMGLKIAEEAYGYKLATKKIADTIEQLELTDDKKQKIFDELSKVFKDENYKPSKEFLDIVSKSFGKGNWNSPDGESTLKTRILTALNGIESLRENAIGEGGHITDTIDDFFGLRNASWTTTCNTTSELFENLKSIEQNNPNLVLTTGSIPLKKVSEKAFQEFQLLFGIGDRGKISLGAQHAYRIDSFDLNNKTISIVNPWDTSKIVVLTFEQFMKFFDTINVSDISKKIEADKINSKVIELVNEYDINLKTQSGRVYSETELVEKYAKKLQQEKNMRCPTQETISKIDIPENFYKIPSVKKFTEKFIYNNEFVSIITQTIYQNCGLDKRKINNAIKSIESILSNPNLNIFDFFDSIIGCKHSDYDFIIKIAPETITKLQKKGYSSNTIGCILKNISKENYNEMKKLWE